MRPHALSETRHLPSWSESPRKRDILAFVRAVSSGPHAVPPEERIATFDNDGTLWCEKPLPQAEFVAWERRSGRVDPTERAYEQRAREFLATATHPRFGVPYPDLAYQPMKELIGLLNDHDFKVFLCSGGGVSFMRAFSEGTYGVPRERVIGSNVTWECVVIGDGATELLRKPLPASLDDGPGKPVHIQLHVGRRPLLVAGNSDGDAEMFLHARAGTRPWLAVLIEHDDPVREFAYSDGTAAVRNLAARHAFDPGSHRGFVAVSMKDDFETLF